MAENLGSLLIVDDEPAGLAGLRCELAQAGYDVLEAQDAAEGLACLATRRVDAVLTDLHMPGMDGLQLLSRIKAQAPHVAVMIMTAHGSIETAVKAIKYGACDYLPKPVSAATLLRKLEDLRSGDGDAAECCVAMSKPASAVAASDSTAPRLEGWPDGAGLTETIAGVERSLIDAALRKAAGNQAKAAQFLGIPRTTLRDKMAKHGMVNPSAKRITT